ncbi:MAG: hypothetical protein DME23_23020 [Verrucomicrobia bacterium]|nr:MAG: hypothetical protein DME23_23020 [Verrucomicrobiota bacterium]
MAFTATNNIFMSEWNIQSRAHACQACGRPFADKRPYHTILFDEKAGYGRLDVCEGCWAAHYRVGAASRKGFVSHWQGVFEVPPAQAEPIQKETAESLLRKLLEQNDLKYGAACFILAVMLERKRILKVKEQLQRHGQRVFIYEHPKTGDVFTIADPDLRLDQVDEVQRDVAHLLEQGLNPPGGAQPAASSSTGSTETNQSDNARAEPLPKPREQPAVG